MINGGKKLNFNGVGVEGSRTAHVFFRCLLEASCHLSNSLKYLIETSRFF